MRRAILSIFMMFLALPALAADQNDGSAWLFGGDAYMAGRSVLLSGETANDAFLAGDTVTARADIGGSAHMAGRTVTLQGRVGDNFYGAGMTVAIEAPVAGNVTVTGNTVTINEPVSGNLRASGGTVEIAAPVAGSAVLAGGSVTLNGVVSGDLAVASEDPVWGDAARVEGDVHIYTDTPDAISVPERVAPAGRVIVHETGQFDEHGMPGAERPSFLARLRGWLGGVLVIGVLGTILAAVAPQALADMRTRATGRPLWIGLIGFVGLSTLLGSVVLLAMTGFGIVLAPVSLLAAFLLGLAGYVIGAYALGVWAVRMSGRGAPSSTGARAVAAFIGAAFAALLALIPWIGWLLVMAIVLVGAGALVAKVLHRRDGLSAA